jgi:NADP-dependent aldehyde dehydrogenase
MLITTDPRTAEKTDTGLKPTTVEEVAALGSAAVGALPALADLDLRARLLDAMAAAVDAHRDALVATAMRETGLAQPRLNGEAGRSAFQFSLFATAVREGSFLEATIDHAGDTPLGPAPDIRRMLVPLGPVAVFGSSNFPFAFSVLGGDVASAIAAGCPVVIKAHGSHLLTSALSFSVLLEAAKAVGAPDGTFGIVFGQAAGVALVKDPSIAAVGFTGSLGAANALRAAIDERSEPIPFYGELSSINPLVISAGAAAARGQAIAEGLFGSFTGSAGQLCTKPGIAFIPDGRDGQVIVDALAALTADAPAQVLLNDRISSSFADITTRLEAAGGTLLARATATGDGFSVAPAILQTTAAELDEDLAEECFGPMLVIARYGEGADVQAALGRIPKSLTTTIHVEDDERAFVEELEPVMRKVSGRVVFNGYPTGVRVTWGQQHGGPWPATNSIHTSVGVTAMRRFLRPVAWQDAPQWTLPEVLRDGFEGIPRRVDGSLVSAPAPLP